MTRFSKILFLGAALIMTAQPALAEKSLTEQLADKAAASKANMPKEVLATMANSEQSLRDANLADKAPKAGDALPDGSFVTAKGEPSGLFDAIGDGPAIVTFYRGGWCPYCNLQLHAYQQHLPAIKAAGATLVAITPETPDNSLDTTQKNELQFAVLSDANNEYARKIGIVFELDEKLKEAYLGFGIDLEKNQSNGAWELPLAATFIIDADRTVRYAYVDVDYKKRADPEELIAKLQELKK